MKSLFAVVVFWLAFYCGSNYVAMRINLFSLYGFHRMPILLSLSMNLTCGKPVLSWSSLHHFGFSWLVECHMCCFCLNPATSFPISLMSSISLVIPMIFMNFWFPLPDCNYLYLDISDGTPIWCDHRVWDTGNHISSWSWKLVLNNCMSWYQWSVVIYSHSAILKFEVLELSIIFLAFQSSIFKLFQLIIVIRRSNWKE